MATTVRDQDGNIWIIPDPGEQVWPIGAPDGAAVTGAVSDGGQAAIRAVTAEDDDASGSDAGSPAGSSATGLGWPDWGVLSQTKEFPWLLLGVGLILMVMASRRHGRR